MNRKNKQSDREILEEILMNMKASPVVVQPSMKVYNNKEVMELLGVKDKYLKKLFQEKAISIGIRRKM